MTGRQIRALAGKEYSQNSVALFTQRKAYRIGVTLGRQPAAGFRIPQIAARFQLIFARARALVPGSCARARPSPSQGKSLWKWPVRVKLCFWHEEGTGHKILAQPVALTPIVTVTSILRLKWTASVLIPVGSR